MARGLSSDANISGAENNSRKNRGSTFGRFKHFFVWALISSGGWHLFWKLNKQRANSNTNILLEEIRRTHALSNNRFRTKFNTSIKDSFNKANILKKGMRRKYKECYNILMSTLGTPTLLTKVSYIVNRIGRCRFAASKGGKREIPTQTFT